MDNHLAKDLAQNVADFYEKHGDAFSRTRHQHWDVFDLIHAACKPGMTLIDVGAGNGRLADFLPKEIDYIGIEPSSSLRGNNTKLTEGRLPLLPTKDDSSDITVCLAVFHHIPAEDQKAAVDELIRITKNGGLIVATAWHLSLEPGNHMIDWKAEGADAKRFVYIFSDEEWRTLWIHPCLSVEQVGFDKNTKNRLVVARKTC